MGLFQKKPQASSNMPSYRIGLQNTLMIVGLGNPGKEYEDTRHNIGFKCLDAFARAQAVDKWSDKRDLKCQLAQTTAGDNRIILVKPQTYMNLSGEAAQAAAGFYKIPTSCIVAVYDEIDIPFGQIRTRSGGGDGGHNGVKSLIQHLGEEFGRLRVGTNNSDAINYKSEDFVLSRFNSDETSKLEQVAREVIDILTSFSHTGNLTEETRKVIL